MFRTRALRDGLQIMTAECVSYSFSSPADARGAEQTHRRPPGAHQTPAGEARQAERAHQDAAESGGRNGLTPARRPKRHSHKSNFTLYSSITELVVYFPNFFFFF